MRLQGGNNRGVDEGDRGGGVSQEGMQGDEGALAEGARDTQRGKYCALYVRFFKCVQ